MSVVKGLKGSYVTKTCRVSFQFFLSDNTLIIIIYWLVYKFKITNPSLKSINNLTPNCWD